MNKTELKKFAVSARRDLLEKVALRARMFGVDEKSDLIVDEQFGQLTVNGTSYPTNMKTMFNSLATQLKSKGYEQLIEEVAYTWFNRIIAIRYMEVNGYLPERVNVLSSNTGKVDPDILSEYDTMDLDIDTAKVKSLIEDGKTEEAYRILFIAQCNALNKILPFMFEEILDYTELLLPDFLLDSESIINQLVVNEELINSFTEVEVIGWLYQFYNSEPKDVVFANLKKNKKIEKYDIPAATQLFTPKWIVQYMVENSLGQLLLESNGDSPLKQSMHYYIEPSKQDTEMTLKLEEIQYKNISLEEITVIDPCVGSGHILVYAFDLLYQMYEEAGYPTGDIPQLILEKNLYGLDIDDRAVQLASFALMMKAREKSRRIFRKQISLNIFSIQESKDLDKEEIAKLLGDSEEEISEITLMLETFINAKTFGSILKPKYIDVNKYLKRIEGLGEEQLSVEDFQAYEQMNKVVYLLKQVQILSNKYDITVTNPPYIGSKGMNQPLKSFVGKQYPDSKSDMYAVFIEKALDLTKSNGYCALVTQHSWMFIGSYKKLREKILDNETIYSMVHLGPRAFEEIGGEVVQTTSFVLKKSKLEYTSAFVRLVDYANPKTKEEQFNSESNYFYINQKELFGIPGTPIAYWVTKHSRNIFESNITLGEIASPKAGLQTGNNEKFVRNWFEVAYSNIGFSSEGHDEAANSKKKWFPYNKGGSFRKWYGNQDYVVNWKNYGEDIHEFNNVSIDYKGAPVRNKQYYFKEGLTWSFVSSSNFGVRYTPKGFVFDVGGSTAFPEKEWNMYLLGFLTSKLGVNFLKMLNPTMNFQVSNIKSLPMILKEDTKDINELVLNSIDISKNDWDSLETSWGFKCHPLITFSEGNSLLENAFTEWTLHKENQRESLKKYEEELNRIFIELYSLEDELTPDVLDVEITIGKADRVVDSKSFLSYFIGCVLGRYSLDKVGLIFTGEELDNSIYNTFKPNKFGLIHLTGEQYFTDDIISRLREFVSVVFGAETVSDNLQWLAKSLGIKGNESAEERLRRYFLEEFFIDHCSTQSYRKYPIYWLVDSGEQKALRTLIYMHRYKPDTMATIRFEHLQEIQTKYNNEISAVDLRIVNPNLSATEKRDLEKRKTTFQNRLDELLEFDKKLAKYANEQIKIDLDVGVKENYAKFGGVLAKIK